MIKYNKDLYYEDEMALKEITPFPLFFFPLPYSLHI